MRNWLPYPFASLALGGLWLLLNQTLDPSHILLGAALGVAAPLLTRRLVPLGFPKLHAPIIALQLFVMASTEILRSCVAVCQGILFTKATKLRSEFIRVPLRMRDPYGLAMLSCLINMTPGTVWTELQEDGNVLVLHVFDLHDAAWWNDTIRTRYEEPLMAIFETEAAHGDAA